MSATGCLSGQMDEQLPEMKNIITIEMLDQRVADINRLITSSNRLLPNSIDASMAASDEFLELLNKFLEQKLLLAKKCVEMSSFVEDLHALTALTLTPALIMMITVILVCYSQNYFPSIPIFSTWIIPNVSTELKPFMYFCFIPFPLYLYFSYVIIMKWRSPTEQREQIAVDFTVSSTKKDLISTLLASIYPKLKGWSGCFDEVVIGTYPRLKSWSEIFRDNNRRGDFLFKVWALTGYIGVLLLGVKLESFFIRVMGLIIVGGINFITGSLLVKLSNFSSSLCPFYSPLEMAVRITSFSPIFYTILGTVAALFIPVITEQVDYNFVREKSIKAICIAEEKLKGIIAVRAGMRNVREVVSVTTHVQTFSEGLLERKIDREAGMAIATEGTKVTGKIIKWTGSKIMEKLSSPELETEVIERTNRIENEDATCL